MPLILGRYHKTKLGVLNSIPFFIYEVCGWYNYRCSWIYRRFLIFFLYLFNSIRFIIIYLILKFKNIKVLNEGKITVKRVAFALFSLQNQVFTFMKNFIEVLCILKEKYLKIWENVELPINKNIPMFLTENIEKSDSVSMGYKNEQNRKSDLTCYFLSLLQVLIPRCCWETIRWNYFNRQ